MQCEHVLHSIMQSSGLESESESVSEFGSVNVNEREHSTVHLASLTESVTTSTRYYDQWFIAVLSRNHSSRMRTDRAVTRMGIDWVAIRQIVEAFNWIFYEPI